MTPYLSLRQAVRPAVFAHGLMAGNRAGSARLAAECDELLQLTRELLRATGRAALLGADESSNDFSHNGTGTPPHANPAPAGAHRDTPDPHPNPAPAHARRDTPDPHPNPAPAHARRDTADPDPTNPDKSEMSGIRHLPSGEVAVDPGLVKFLVHDSPPDLSQGPKSPQETNRAYHEMSDLGYGVRDEAGQVERAPGERATGEPTPGERATGERATGERAAGERAAGERAAGERALGDWAAGEWAPGERTTGERTTGERALGERTTGERAPGERALLDAYADAAMAWAKVIGSLMALGGTLLEQGDWADVRRLADVLADAGEANLARDLRIRLGAAIFGAYRDHLQRIGNAMPPDGIARSVEVLRAVLREVPEDFPDRNREVNRLLAPLAVSVYKVMKARGVEAGFDSRVEHIATGGVAGYPEIVTTSLDELAAEFESLYR